MKNFQAADDTVAVVAITLTPDGLVTNCNPRKPQPHYDKFPGGRAKVGEKREAAVRRELEEECGITEVLAIEYLFTDYRQRHDLYVYGVVTRQTAHHRGRSREINNNVGLAEVNKKIDDNKYFEPEHLRIFRDARTRVWLELARKSFSL